MKKVVTLVSFIFLAIIGLAQEERKHEKLMVDDVLIYAEPDTSASYPGGKAAMVQFMLDNLAWPEGMEKKDITIVVDLIVEIDGSITFPQHLYNVRIQPYLTAIAEMFRRMPRWIPARYDMRTVRQQIWNFKIPFRQHQKRFYSNSEFLAMFPQLQGNELHVYFDEGEWRSNSLMMGKSIDAILCPQLYDFEVYCHEEGAPYAIGQFAMDRHHTGLLLRGGGHYQDDQIRLLVWDNERQKIVKAQLLANESGDAGYMEYSESWLTWGKKGMKYERREVWHEIDIENIFDNQDAPNLTIDTIVCTLERYEWNGEDFSVTQLDDNLELAWKFQMQVRYPPYVLQWHLANCGCPYHVLASDMAQFIGGQEAIDKHFANLKRGKSKDELKVLLTIGKDGSVESACLLNLVKGVDINEVKRLAESMPKWIPAKYEGEPVLGTVIITI